ncbi:MAG: DUF87 domain-containing protein, partial [Kofleriaceae bacterium]|nr:DUF87 domain-containing protein [Kofleriaceae bacterium]
MSVVSLQLGARIMGPAGHGVGGLAYGLAGVCAYALIATVGYAAVRALIGQRPISLELAIGVALGATSVATLLHLAAGGYRVAGHGPGGILGEGLAEILRAVISTAGTALLGVVGLFVAVVIATPLRMRQVLAYIGAGLGALGAGAAAGVLAAARFVADVVRAILPEPRDARDDEDDVVDDDDVLELGEDDKPGREPVIVARTRADKAAPAAELDGDTEQTPTEDVLAASAGKKRKARATETTELDAAATEEVVVLGADAGAPGKGKRERRPRGTEPQDTASTPTVSPAVAGAALAAVGVSATEAAPAIAAATKPGAPTPGAPMIVESRFMAADKSALAAKETQAEAERQSFIKLGDGEYQLPSIQLLKFDPSSQNTIDKSAMLELSARLTQTLENYGVKGDVVAIRPGPVVTMYEFAPAPGTRVNKIVNLTDDLALALEALRVRIVAPIPGKAAVGIEVPNKSREKVFMKEIVADDSFLRSKAKLPMTLGKDIEGGPAVVDLAKMPHLLVAGTTGSGKSVAVNAMITSLLYKCSPEDVRMIMVDPKMLELSIYEGIPHLLLPVVTDPKKANLALRWAVDEMERRYDLLAQAGVRDISVYNEKMAKNRAKWEADKLREAADAAARALEVGVQEALALGDGDGAVAGAAAASDDGSAPRRSVTPPPHKLPFIVVVIDEFADLMMCAPKEVETSVARIAQKARAAGIHLILATQRPSVDVITGLIKANFPSRVAFHVTSKIDSRTILDQSGAEALLGAGDMLFSDRGAAPTRLHGCYIDEEEIHAVVEFLKTQGRPVYNLDILKPREEEGEGGDVDM